MKVAELVEMLKPQQVPEALETNSRASIRQSEIADLLTVCVMQQRDKYRNYYLYFRDEIRMAPYSLRRPGGGFCGGKPHGVEKELLDALWSEELGRTDILRIKDWTYSREIEARHSVEAADLAATKAKAKYRTVTDFYQAIALVPLPDPPGSSSSST